MKSTDFLSDLVTRPWSLSGQHQIQPVGLFIGNGPHAVEVAVGQSTVVPSEGALTQSWRTRKGHRAAPVLLVVLHPEGASICGADGPTPSSYAVADPEEVEGLCRLALGQPDRHEALTCLAQALPSLEIALAGIRNEGLVAMHELRHGVPSRSDWDSAGRKASQARGTRNSDLLRALGYRIERLDNKRLCRALAKGPYPRMGTGDPDLYKAFCWRFWRLTAANGGRIGVVLPRSALSAKGSTHFRRMMFGSAGRVDVTMLLNNRHWVFPEVDPRYSIGLVCITRGDPAGKSILLRGPFASMTAFSPSRELWYNCLPPDRSARPEQHRLPAAAS